MEQTDKQVQILHFLEDLHQTLTTSKVKTIDTIKKDHSISASVSVVIGILKIIEKVDGFYQWTADETPSKKMALIVDEADRTYNRNSGKLAIFKPLLDLENGERRFLYSFKDFWEVPGYTLRQNAKRAIFQRFTENEDYIISINKDGNTNGNTGVSEGVGRPEENILMTLTCLKLFIAMAQTPIGTHFAEKFIRHTEEQTTKYLKHATQLSTRGKKIRDLDEAISLLKKYQTQMATNQEEAATNGALQLSFDFDKSTYNQSLIELAESVNDLIMRNIQLTQIGNNGSQTKYLPEGRPALLNA